MDWRYDSSCKALGVQHLGCFHSLAIVNSAAMIIGIQVSLLHPDLGSFGKIPGVVQLDHMAVLSLAFQEISMLLSIVVGLICIPKNSV
jgi:hypothetical protein